MNEAHFDFFSQIKLFTGNCDQSTHFTNRFSPPILARYVLLAPVAWHAHIALRFELLGEGPFMLPDIAVHWRDFHRR